MFEKTLRSALALDQLGSPFARTTRTRVLRLSMPIEPEPEGHDEVGARLGALLA